MKRNGFTLIELLVVLAIVGLLAALLFPVFAKAREKGRQASCLSNERQLAMAMLQYVQDHDETFPYGTIFPGGSWAGRCYPYLKNADVFACPDETVTPYPLGKIHVDSYGLNTELSPFLVVSKKFTRSGGPPIALAALSAPVKTTLFFEVDKNLLGFATVARDKYPSRIMFDLGPYSAGRARS